MVIPCSLCIPLWVIVRLFVSSFVCICKRWDKEKTRDRLIIFEKCLENTSSGLLIYTTGMQISLFPLIASYGFRGDKITSFVIPIANGFQWKEVSSSQANLQENGFHWRSGYRWFIFFPPERYIYTYMSVHVLSWVCAFSSIFQKNNYLLVCSCPSPLKKKIICEMYRRLFSLINDCNHFFRCLSKHFEQVP